MSSGPSSSRTAIGGLLRLATAVGVALACAGTAPVSPARGEEVEPAATEAAALVEQLGSGGFAEREQAARRLVELGLEAEQALAGALASPDAEVRSRAERILAVVRERDFQARLRAFTADETTDASHGLAGWERFAQATGGDASARRLFIAMQREEGPLLEIAESDIPLAGQLLEERARLARESIYDDGFGARRTPIGQAAAIFFVASQENIPFSDEAADAVAALLASPALQANIKSGLLAPPLGKLIMGWMERIVNGSHSPLLRVQCLSRAMELDWREQSVRLALAIVKDPQSDPFARGLGVLIVGRLGDRQHVPELTPLLTDEQECFSDVRDERRWQCQVRDTALYALLRLYGQDVEPYGFTFLDKQEEVEEPTDLGFANQDERAAALDRWKQWAEKEIGAE